MLLHKKAPEEDQRVCSMVCCLLLMELVPGAIACWHPAATAGFSMLLPSPVQLPWSMVAGLWQNRAHRGNSSQQIMPAGALVAKERNFEIL